MLDSNWLAIQRLWIPNRIVSQADKYKYVPHLHPKAMCKPWTQVVCTTEETTTHSITCYFSESLSSSSLLLCGRRNANSKAIPFALLYSNLFLWSCLLYQAILGALKERAGTRQRVVAEDITKRSPLQHPSDRKDKNNHIQAVQTLLPTLLFSWWESGCNEKSRLFSETKIVFSKCSLRFPALSDIVPTAVSPWNRKL